MPWRNTSRPRAWHLTTDQAERLAAGRRQRRLGAVPAQLRPAAARFSEHMLAARQRARRAGTRPRTDHTIETALAIVRDLAVFLAGHRGKQDWALTDVHDIEAFLATLPKARKRRLTLPRSSGTVEGNVNRIKMLKRQMYGRASFPLLRQRVLAA